MIWVDPVLVAQLIDNLLDNAFKYSEPGTPITLSVAVEAVLAVALLYAR